MGKRTKETDILSYSIDERFLMCFSPVYVKMQSDPDSLTDLEAEVTEECVKLGPLERLKVKCKGLSVGFS